METRINRLVNKSFEQTLLDSPVPNVKVKFPLSRNKSKSKLKWETIKSLPEPLKPTKYVPPKPTPKPRPKPTPKPRVLSKRPVPLPRRGRRSQPKLKLHKLDLWQLEKANLRRIRIRQPIPDKV